MQRRNALHVLPHIHHALNNLRDAGIPVLDDFPHVLHTAALHQHRACRGRQHLPPSAGAALSELSRDSKLPLSMTVDWIKQNGDTVSRCTEPTEPLGGTVLR